MIREKTLQRYLISLLKEQRIIDFVNNHSAQGMNGFYPMLVVVDHVTSARWSKDRWRISGAAYNTRTCEACIEVTKWICADDNEAKSTVRHELAHCIQGYCKLPGSSHGRGFTQALKIVSPKKFRYDRHWHSTDKVEKARSAMKSKYRKCNQ